MGHATNRMRRGWTGVLLAAAVAVRAVAEPASGGATVAELQQQAMVHARAGRWEAAAQVYERVLELDAGFASALAPQVVQLYARAGRSAQALAWTQRVMASHPEPEAYLAGVLARVGQPVEARLVLRRALRQAAGPSARQRLYWQLADLELADGATNAAVAALGAALGEAASPADQTAARARLEALRATRPLPATNAVQGESPKS